MKLNDFFFQINSNFFHIFYFKKIRNFYSQSRNQNLILSIEKFNNQQNRTLEIQSVENLKKFKFIKEILI